MSENRDNNDSSVLQSGYGLKHTMFDIQSLQNREYHKLGVSGVRLQLKFKQPDSICSNDWSEKCFDEILEYIQLKFSSR